MTATGTLRHPFSLGPDGSARTVSYGSDTQVDQYLAVMILTRVGERLWNPEYGITDPEFAGLDESDIQTNLDTFGPEGVTLSGITETVIDEATVSYKVEWAREDTIS